MMHVNVKYSSFFGAKDRNRLLNILRLVFFTLSHYWLLASASPQNMVNKLISAAKQRTHNSIRYDGHYVRIPYPNGDVPANIGVCTDVIIRSFRAIGIDLQQKVHEDMLSHFAAYPSKRIWGLTKPDPNIDHRRVPNLQVFFSRNGQSLAITHDPQDYQPGDLVTWMLPGQLPHIGIIVDRMAQNSHRPMVAHNIGAGPKIDDMLFDYTITGHYRYLGP